MPTPALYTRMPSVESAEKAFEDLRSVLMPEASVVQEESTRLAIGRCGRITLTADYVGLTLSAGRQPAAALLVWHMAPGTPEGRERILERLRKIVA